MVVLYLTLLLLLGVTKYLVTRRATSLERKHARAAEAADRFLREPLPLKQGNSNKPDPYQTAKRQFQLGALVQRADRLEEKCHTWQAWSERFGRALAAVRDWRGRKLPYSFGVLDVWAALALVDHLGFNEYVSARRLVELVTSLIGN